MSLSSEFHQTHSHWIMKIAEISSAFQFVTSWFSKAECCWRLHQKFIQKPSSAQRFKTHVYLTVEAASLPPSILMSYLEYLSFKWYCEEKYSFFRIWTFLPLHEVRGRTTSAEFIQTHVYTLLNCIVTAVWMTSEITADITCFWSAWNYLNLRELL